MICSIELLAKEKEAAMLEKMKAEEEARLRVEKEKEAAKNAELFCETFVNDALIKAATGNFRWIEYTGNNLSYHYSPDSIPTVSIIFGLPYGEYLKVKDGKTALMFPLSPNCRYANGTQSYHCNTANPLNFQHFMNYLKNACYEVKYETGLEYYEYGCGRQFSVKITIKPGVPKCL